MASQPSIQADRKSADASPSNGKAVVATPTPSSIPAESLVPKFSEGDRKQLQETLQASLFDLASLQLVVKQAHWNVVGPTFHPTHLFLDTIWEHVQENTDEVAERLVALGMSPMGQGPEVVKNTGVKPIPHGFLRDMDAIRLIAERIHQTTSDMRRELKPVEDIDTVTADLMHAIIETLEKDLWMLRAHLI